MVELIRYPTDADWYEVKRRALVTVGKTEFEPPTNEWKHKILEARHSPIRYLMFSFYIECPYWVSTHLARHIHTQPYIKSQRNDRQSEYDRNAARQDAPVQMILDVNAEELMVIANKRLCNKAAKETRELIKDMCALVEDKCHEFKEFLVPMCVYHGWVCHEITPCRHNIWDEWKDKKEWE